jgi:hypothetical protein
LKSPKDVLALGQAIVHELELDNRGAVLNRWLAHYLAELMSEIDKSTGPAKATAQQQAVDIILKLWMHRRALPEPVDPLGGYRNTIAVIGRLMPEANPWARYSNQGAYDNLLYQMFETTRRIVLGGVLLTTAQRARSVSQAESAALEGEEIFLMKMLEEWEPFFTFPAGIPKVNVMFTDPDSTPEQDVPEDITEEDTLTSDQSVHLAIVENLERMQSDLTELLTRWKRAAPEVSQFDEEEDNEDEISSDD